MPVELVLEEQRVLHDFDELLVQQQLRDQVLDFFGVRGLLEVLELVLALLFAPVLLRAEVHPQRQVLRGVQRLEDLFDDLQAFCDGLELRDVRAVQVVLNQVWSPTITSAALAFRDDRLGLGVDSSQQGDQLFPGERTVVVDQQSDRMADH